MSFDFTRGNWIAQVHLRDATDFSELDEMERGMLARIEQHKKYSKRTPVPRGYIEWLDEIREFRSLVQPGDEVRYWGDSKEQWNTMIGSIHCRGLAIVREGQVFASLTVSQRIVECTI